MNKKNVVEIKSLCVSVEGKKILKDLNCDLEMGTITALMGPNGSGKSTLANTLMGHPKYKITSGNIFFNGEDITHLSVDERAKKGVFLSFQYPKEIVGVTISNFLRTALNNVKEKRISIVDFHELLNKNMEKLGMNKSFLKRYLNDGFSGGEKKVCEILQLITLNPTFAILDETDSGLDIDALKIVSKGVNSFMNKNKCILIITHYKRILEYVKPNKLFIMLNGKIVLEGDGKLVDKLEEKGYNWIEE